MSVSDHLYLENLDEFINDENKIVTYRWLSLTLNVSSNIAKQMLYHYYDSHKNAKENKYELTVTYLLTGLEHNDQLNQDAYKVCVVQDKDLETMKSRLKEVFSLHIYSIQKGQLKDLHLLYGNDYDKIREDVSQSTRHSSITCPAASVRVSKEVIKLEKESTQPHFTKCEEVAIQDDTTENKENKSSGENVKNNKPAPPKSKSKGSLASLFANQTKKSEAKNASTKSAKPAPTKPLKPASKKGSLAAFLTKDPQPQRVVKREEKKTPTSDEGDSERIKDESPEAVAEKTTVSPPRGQKAPKKEIRKKPEPKAKAKSSSKGKRKSSASSNSDSKRRRILTMDSSSESGSDDEEDQLMDECPLPSPLPVPVLILSDEDDDVIPGTPQNSAHAGDVTSVGKSRTKKLVDSTFMDEDGYLVTKKEYELVIDSDEEDPVPTQSKTESSSPIKGKSPSKTPSPGKRSGRSSKKKTPSPAKKAAKSSSKKKKTSPPLKGSNSPVKMKQVSIMNFFKKK